MPICAYQRRGNPFGNLSPDLGALPLRGSMDIHLVLATLGIPPASRALEVHAKFRSELLSRYLRTIR